MSKKRYSVFGGCLLVLLLCGQEVWAQTPSKLSGELAVLHAGSLSVPLKEITEAFKAQHPDVRVLLEAGGSRTCARKIVDLGQPCDVFASADYSVIDTLMVPEHAAWNIKFAANEMALVYRAESRGADSLTRDNWFEILGRDDVAFGRSEPNADPCGYRAILTLKLAEKHYDVPGLAEQLLRKDRRYVRPKETELLALLEVGAIDYIFLYRSVAKQHDLNYLLFPDEINLKNAELADLYRTVSVEISGEKPGTTITRYGEPMVYGVTIPKNAPNPDAALAFVTFLLEKDEGMAIMEKNGQPSLVPAPSDTYEQIPAFLKRFAIPK